MLVIESYYSYYSNTKPVNLSSANIIEYLNIITLNIKHIFLKLNPARAGSAVAVSSGSLDADGDEDWTLMND